MAGTTYKKRDLNRYRKIYQYLRKKPKNTFYFDKATIIEAYYVEFDGSATTSKSFTTSQVFPSIPYVTATAVDYFDNSSGDINVSVSSISLEGESSGKRATITIEISAPTECRVHVQAIYIGS